VWAYVDSDTSSGDVNTPIVFHLDRRYRYFQLVETQPPPPDANAPNGYDMPRGQWRIFLAYDPDTTDPGSPHYDTEGWEPVGDNWYIRIQAIGDPSIPAFARHPVDSSVDGAGDWYMGNRPILVLPMSGGVGRSPFTFAGFTLLLLALGTMTYQVRRNKLALADSECAGSCADCAHGTKLGTERVFCLRRGVMPIDGGRSRYAPAETSDGDAPSPP
jgi:hypothetical protein